MDSHVAPAVVAAETELGHTAGMGPRKEVLCEHSVSRTCGGQLMPSTVYRPEAIVCPSCEVSWAGPDLRCWVCGSRGSLTAAFPLPWSTHSATDFRQSA